MKIAVAASGLGHVARGNEAWAEDLGAALAARGADVLLCKGGGPAGTPFERVVPCWRREGHRAGRLASSLPSALGWRLGLGSAYGVEQMTFAAGLVGLLRKERADILHVQDPLVALAVQRAGRLGLVGARAILAHGTEEPPGFLRKLDHVQHLADWHLEEARAAGSWKTSWTSIPNFVDTERFRPGIAPEARAELGIPLDAMVVLTVAAIRRVHKRVDYLIDEFARLLAAGPDLPAYLVVAGGWEEDTDELVSQGCERLGDRVRFLVRHPRARMPDLYRAADAFVLCSRKEMLGIVLLEAAASGLPSLVTPHPVLRWVVGPGGEAIPMEGPGDLARPLGALLRDAPRRAALGAAARRHCVATFGRDRVVDRILEYYRAVLAAGRVPA